MFVLKPSPRRLFFIFQELRIASQLAGTNYSKPEIELLMRLVDTDQDGLVTFPEFTSIIKEDLLKNIEALFKIFDTNGDGLLNRAEVTEVLKQLGEEVGEGELADWIARVHSDGLVGLQQLKTFLAERNDSDSSSDDEDEIRLL